MISSLFFPQSIPQSSSPTSSLLLLFLHSYPYHSLFFPLPITKCLYTSTRFISSCTNSGFPIFISFTCFFIISYLCFCFLTMYFLLLFFFLFFYFSFTSCYLF
ncbi:hypothetical protein FRACYDRAFT_268558 [Fragilariopsis cylindrus CCMP1102]|uniref:Uncharacterized protein n=1 Tax=Fragilariopsis cylindrus CCMP1102 TaxID=635003 RepID=A0A1E7FLV4_9STRA|nr:hypothetical protein FRACYDRAFT_268558 [Fragilariopsis cylindrus CCMP1102]|eukprot:OEU19126.1 hypothetical protein FRACYDRAFT_268558 [Fragilariopsis cylindrus CCMP1102]